MRVRLLLIAALLFAGSAHADTVTYKLTITNNWTRAAHPIGYPDIAHFSWLGGGTHASPSDFWSLGGTATPGFELLAESGDTREWVSELEAAGAVPLEWRHWFCPPQQSNPNCGSLSVSFQVSSDEPYLTLASMLGPSPDWFVGVQDLSLRPNGEWASNFSVPLVLNDAGTEGGTTPILDNPPTAEPIQRIAYNSNTGDYVPSNQLFFVGQLDFELLTEPPTEGATRLVSATLAGEGGNGTSWDPAVSADGNLVAFSSDATTLVANDQNGSVRDVFIYNRSTGELRNLTNGGNGASEDPVLSKDGRWLAFVTRATNLPTNVPDTNADVASRAYFKLKEALLWSGLPVSAGDVCAEIGSAPGGACQLLLEMDAKVIAIDPAEMEPELLKHENLNHIRRRGHEVRKRDFRDVRWLFADITMVPNYTLDTVSEIVAHDSVNIKGMALTLKLTNWELLESVPAWIQRVKDLGFKYVRTRQLAFNRQEICLIAAKDKFIVRSGKKRS